MYPKKSAEPQKVSPGSMSHVEHICLYPASSKPAATKPVAAPPKAKPEPTLEQKVADEVARRLDDGIGNLALGFLLGWLWEKHHRD